VTERPHHWVEQQGTGLTKGVPFRFCTRCDREEWNDGTIRVEPRVKCVDIGVEEYMERMKKIREAAPIDPSNSGENAKPQPEELSAGEMLAFMGTDAQAWADEFCRINNIKAGALTPTAHEFQHTLLGWFANAIETGRSAGYVEGHASVPDYMTNGDARKHCPGCIWVDHTP
jgi:hypothetical protein